MAFKLNETFGLGAKKERKRKERRRKKKSYTHVSYNENKTINKWLLYVALTLQVTSYSLSQFYLGIYVYIYERATDEKNELEREKESIQEGQE